jgi:hypothetical protein
MSALPFRCFRPDAMTNPIAFVLGLIIVIGLCVDFFMSYTAFLIFLTKKLTEFTEWLAFWR